MPPLTPWKSLQTPPATMTMEETTSYAERSTIQAVVYGKASINGKLVTFTKGFS